MRQPINLEKIRELKIYHEKLKAEFKAGRLVDKMSRLLIWKSRDIGVSIATYWRKHRSIDS